jgi:hypothetical protein
MSARRARLIAAGRHAAALGLALDRAARFVARRRNETPPAPPAFAELARWPGWPRLGGQERVRAFAAIAVVAGRDTLAREIDGARLRGYAAVLGTDLFEAVLALPQGGSWPLGSAEALSAAGRALAERALPVALAEPMGVVPVADSIAAAWVATAESLILDEAA